MAMQHIHVSTRSNSITSRVTRLVLAAVVGVELALLAFAATLPPVVAALSSLVQ